MLRTVSGVEIPKLICHLAHMVEASLEKDWVKTKDGSGVSLTCDQGSSMSGW